MRSGLLAMAGLDFALLCLAYLVSLVFAGFLEFFITGLGFLQLLWGLPLAVLFQRRGMRRAQRGVLLAIGVVLLVSLTCNGVSLVGSR